MRHSVAAGALGLAAALCCASASAQSAATLEPQASPDSDAPSAAHQPTRVVLVASPGMEGLIARFSAELVSLGLEVVRVPNVEVLPSLAELERLARERRARTAVRISKAGRALDLWLVNPHSHEVIYRRVVAEGDPAVAVLRSLEILRGALVDLRALAPAPSSAPPAAVGDSAPPGAVLQPPPQAGRRFWLALSGALVMPHAGRNVTGGATVGLNRHVASRFALQGELLVPVSEWRVAGRGGSAKVWLGAATLSALVTPWGERTLTPGLGLGLGVVGLRTSGDAEAGYRGSSDLSLALFSHGRIQLELELAKWLRLRAAVVAGFASPRPVLLFADQREESWLNPLVLSSLGIEVALP